MQVEEKREQTDAINCNERRGGMTENEKIGRLNERGDG